MGHKNDYSVVVFFQSGNPKKWKFVHTLNSLSRFLHKNHPGWKYFNVYDRKTGQYLKRFYNGNFIPAFLSMLILFGTFLYGSHFHFSNPLNSTFNNFRELLGCDWLTFNYYCHSLGQHLGTFTNGFNNTATIWTLSKQKGGLL